MSRKAVRVEYGRANAILFERSDDGVLRARDAQTKSELWAFTPPEVASAPTNRGLMTDLTVLRFDANGDGVIDGGSGDRVWLYFGLRRAGPFYYALDVTNRTPTILWQTRADTLDGLGEAWSTPTLSRVRIAGATQNGEHFVLVVGGGLDGNGLFMLDAATGHRLWSAGSDARSDLVLPQMDEGFAARVAVIDFDGDEFADRLYAADLGGRLWRFDIWNGKARAELVTGGTLATLGDGAPGSTEARRFFNAPDVALIQSGKGRSYFNIAIGSGDATALRAADTRDRFYSIRDREPFTKRSQSAYDAATPVLDADLIDITASPMTARVPDDAPGWKLDLASSGTSSGEKVLAESLTANGMILFTTFEPGGATGCDETGINRVYAVRVDSGSAALDLDDDSKVTTADRSARLEQDGIAGEPRIELSLPGTGDSAGAPTEAQPPGAPDPPGGDPMSARCMVGTEVLKHCMPFGTVLRTYWKRTTIN